jgi:hypothetical protein
LEATGRIPRQFGLDIEAVRADLGASWATDRPSPSCSTRTRWAVGFDLDAVREQVAGLSARAALERARQRRGYWGLEGSGGRLGAKP